MMSTGFSDIILQSDRKLKQHTHSTKILALENKSLLEHLHRAAFQMVKVHL